MSKISLRFELAVKEGKREALEAFATNAVQAVRDGEPGTLGYRWSMADDGARCLLTEEYGSSEALLTHLENVGPALPQLFELASVTRVEALGPVNEDARAALAGLGAQHFSNLAGFRR